MQSNRQAPLVFHGAREFGRKIKASAKKVLVRRGMIRDIDYYRTVSPLLESNDRRADANGLISQAIVDVAPFMAARLGRSEIRFLSKVLVRSEMSRLEIFVHRMIEGTDLIWAGKDSWFFTQFGGSVDRAKLFLSLYRDAMTMVDVLGSWSPGESIFADELGRSSLDDIGALEPYKHSDPWSQYLSGMRVLVVHPFTHSIKSQFENSREKLFEATNVLPAFHLITLCPFMEGIRDPAEGQDLITQFEIIREEMFSKEFDVAIIGAGPNGFLLASEVKSAGKVAIHLGGATQLLFGIRGMRWEKKGNSENLFNQFWVRPSPSETPPLTGITYDGGAYW